jgi:hypothetical protein
MEEQKRSAQQMVEIVREDPERLKLLKAKGLPELQKLAKEAEKATTTPAYITDPWLYRIAVIVLGSLAIMAAIGSLILAVNGRTTPEVLVALGSAAVGALVGLFAPSPTGK